MKNSSIIATKTEKDRYKFVFEDGNTSFQDAEGYREAVILTIANRIRSNKTKKIIGAWVRNKETPKETWDHLVQDTVVIQLK